jgi:hypothetical protein
MTNGGAASAEGRRPLSSAAAVPGWWRPLVVAVGLRACVDGSRRALRRSSPDTSSLSLSTKSKSEYRYCRTCSGTTVTARNQTGRRKRTPVEGMGEEEEEEEEAPAECGNRWRRRYGSGAEVDRGAGWIERLGTRTVVEAAGGLMPPSQRR